MARPLRSLPRWIHEASVASLLKLVRHMEGELACEELKTQCPSKGKMGYVPPVPEFPPTSRLKPLGESRNDSFPRHGHAILRTSFDDVLSRARIKMQAAVSTHI